MYLFVKNDLLSSKDVPITGTVTSISNFGNRLSLHLFKI